MPDAEASSPPLLTLDGAVATVTLNRPQHRNRLHADDLRCLQEHFARVDADPAIRVLVLQARTLAERPVFSAGFHMGEFGESAAEPVALFEATVDRLERVRPLTLAALGGSVYGGATDLALACDFRIGVTGMALRMPAAAIGLHYYPHGLQRFVARLGWATARRLFLLAQTWSDEELLACGYLDRLVAPDQWASELNVWVDRLTGLAPLAVEGMKRSLMEMARGESRMDEWRARESISQRSADFAEGRAAAEERRPPRFRGV